MLWIFIENIFNRIMEFRDKKKYNCGYIDFYEGIQKFYR